MTEGTRSGAAFVEPVAPNRGQEMAVKDLTDLIVVLPGILGSTLAKNGELVWAPSAGAAIRAIRTLGRSIKSLKLPKEWGDDHPKDGVEPVALMPDLHVLPGIWSANIGYGVLLDWLESRFHLIRGPLDDPDRIPNLLPVAYDWRLSNRYNGRRLKGIVEPALERWRSQGGPFAEARVVFICHSMGGLVARWYIEKEGGAEITAKLVTLGTPFRGALNSLDQLVNGVKKGIWPLKLNLTDLARSLPSVYQLLPEYACIESPKGLLKTTEASLTDTLPPSMLTDAMAFHQELDEAASSHPLDSYALHPSVGTRQRTATTARMEGEGLEAVETIEGEDEGGDATVPRLSAAPQGAPRNIIRWPAEKHGSLQANRAVRDELDGVLTDTNKAHRGSGGTELRVDMEEIILAGEPLDVRAVPENRMLLQATVTDEAGRRVASIPLRPAQAVNQGTVKGLAPGAYEVVVGGVGPTAPLVASVRSTVLVWEPEPA